MLDVDLESSLLSKLTTVEALRFCWDAGLNQTAFEDPLNARIYQFAIDYWITSSMEVAPTPEVIHTEFGHRLLPDSPESLTWLVGKLQERFTVNQTQELIRGVLPKINEDPSEALNELFSDAWRIKEQTAPRNARSNFIDNIQERRDRYLDRQEGRAKGAPLGLPEVDDFFGGTRPGEITLAAGFAKTGKSMLLVKSGVESRRTFGTPCIFTLELTIPEWEDRMDCHASGVGYGKMQDGALDLAEVKRIHESQEEMAELGPIYIERPEPGQRTATYMVNRARQLGADYIIIDQLSWMETERYYRERRDQYKEMMYSLKTEIGRESAGQLPCLLAVQFNRESRSKKGGRGGMENIANSADVEQSMDIAFGLYRNEEMAANNAMIMDVIGSRRTSMKSWMLDWYLGNETRIEVLEEHTD